MTEESSEGSGRFDPYWMAYRVLLIALLPLWFPIAAWELVVGKSRLGRAERIGLGEHLPVPEGRRVWLHGVSVGEVQSLAPIVRSLLERDPSLDIVVSVQTVTGRERAEQLLGDLAHIRFRPIDLPFMVESAFRRIRPDAVVLGESELWPSLLRSAARAGPVLLLNARISDRTFRRVRHVRRAYGWLLSHLSLAGARSPEDAARLRELGVPEDRIRLTGSTKFDEAGTAISEEARQAWRELLGFGSDPVLVAGSTFPGEEEILAEALARVRRSHPTARLLVAPRDVSRAPAIVALMRHRGFRAALRSGSAAHPPSTAVVVLDTMGELSQVYAASDIAYVGRSLAHGGGQSPIEPMAVGVPVLHGPRMENFRAVASEAEAAGASRTVRSAEELATLWSELIEDESRRRSMGAAGRRLVDRNRGAAGRSADLVLEVLPAGVRGEDSVRRR